MWNTSSLCATKLRQMLSLFFYVNVSTVRGLFELPKPQTFIHHIHIYHLFISIRHSLSSLPSFVASNMSIKHRYVVLCVNNFPSENPILPSGSKQIASTNMCLFTIKIKAFAPTIKRSRQTRRIKWCRRNRLQRKHFTSELIMRK